MESQKIHQTITIVYGAFLVSSFVYVLVAVFLQTTQWKPVMPEIAFPLFAGLLLIAVINVSLVFQQKSALFSGNQGRIDGDFRQRVTSRCMVWFALLELPAILGFVFFMLSGNLPGMLVLVGVSVAGLTVTKPSVHQLEELERRQ